MWLPAVLPIFLDSGASHNWFVHNTVYGFGAYDAEGTDGFRIGHSGDSTVNHNTFEANTIYHMGHATAEDYGTHNVWLNNDAHNEGWKPDGFTADIIYGTATGGASGTMIDTGTNLVTAGVTAGMYLFTASASTSSPNAVGIVDSITTTTNTNDTANFHLLSYWLPAFTAGTKYAFAPSAMANVPDPPGVLPGDGKYGHRNVLISNDTPTIAAKYVLFEGNRVGYASINYANRGAEGLSLGSPGNIIRYNAFFGSDASGIGIKQYSGGTYYGENNRIYSNTFYKNGQAQTSTSTGYYCYAVSDLYDYVNVYKNNLSFSNGNTACPGGDFSVAAGTFAANLCATTNGPTACTATADPGFTSTTMTDPHSATVPNFALTVGADAINKGGALTTANGAGVATTALIVVDALYFQDGTLGSSLSKDKVVFADWIAVGTVSNIAAVSSVNYATNTITLASALSWSNGASVWLYKRADGVRVLYDTAPDAGAFEYGAGSVVAPTTLVVR
jgi:hypothetical protein